MRPRHVVAAALVVLGIAFLAGWIAGDAAQGPRLGIGMALLTFGLLGLAIPLTTWILRMTTRPEDYEGTCPVGQSCPDCGAFNLYPRKTCRSCHITLPEAAPDAGPAKEAL